jgi:hypothetical protein
MISKPMYIDDPLIIEVVTDIVCSVAVNLYQTSCDVFGAHPGTEPFIIAPLKVPLVVTQAAFGIN